MHPADRPEEKQPPAQAHFAPTSVASVQKCARTKSQAWWSRSRSATSRGSKFGGSTMFLFTFIFMMVARIGEAAHPGPYPRFGIANPTGALNKSHLFQEASDLSAPTTWAISETHLTKEGIQRFRHELKFKSSQWKYIPGAPAQPLTKAPGCIGGKYTGVGILTNSAARALPNDWSQETWESARLQACTVRTQQQWVKLGVAYGYAKQPHTRATREATDQILENLTERIVFQSKGYRILCGDLNQDDPDALEQFAIWREHGFMEVQDIAAQKWGQSIQPTCHGKTRKDHMWISPELIPKLRKVIVDPTYFADHAILIAEFEEFGNTPPVPIWRKPGQIPWEEIDVDTFHQEFQDPQCQGGGMTEIFTCLETAVDSHMKGKRMNGLLAQQKGRCQTTAASMCKHAITPNRPSRKGDVQITYMGEHFIHTKWCRQLRRLQSLHCLMQSTKPPQQLQVEKEDLWQAIKSAAGFGGVLPRHGNIELVPHRNLHMHCRRSSHHPKLSRQFTLTSKLSLRPWKKCSSEQDASEPETCECQTPTPSSGTLPNPDRCRSALLWSMQMPTSLRSVPMD